MTPSAEPLLLKPAEAARLLCIGRSKVYDLINRGELPSVVLGPRCTRIPRAEVERIAQARERVN
jgi:excisionase family DNA binding protein